MCPAQCARAENRGTFNNGLYQQLFVEAADTGALSESLQGVLAALMLCALAAAASLRAIAGEIDDPYIRAV